MDAKQALSDLIDAIDEAGAFIDLEAGASGNGFVVDACRAIGKPIPPKLAEWLGEAGIAPDMEGDDA